MRDDKEIVQVPIEEVRVGDEFPSDVTGHDWLRVERVSTYPEWFWLHIEAFGSTTPPPRQRAGTKLLVRRPRASSKGDGERAVAAPEASRFAEAFERAAWGESVVARVAAVLKDNGVCAPHDPNPMNQDWERDDRHRDQVAKSIVRVLVPTLALVAPVSSKEGESDA